MGVPGLGRTGTGVGVDDLPGAEYAVAVIQRGKHPRNDERGKIVIKVIAGLVIALGVVFFAQTPAEACCIDYGDNSSSSSWYDGGRGDPFGPAQDRDWSGRDNTYGYQDRSLIERYNSYGYGDDRANSSRGYDWGSGYDDRGGLDNTYGYEDHRIIDPYNDYGLGSTDYWGDNDQESLVPWNGNYNFGPADPGYSVDHYTGTEYDYGLGSYYDQDSFGNRSYHETARPLDAYEVRHTSWLGRYLQSKPWSFKVDLSALCGFWC
jgi:hypothetical protein